METAIFDNTSNVSLILPNKRAQTNRTDVACNGLERDSKLFLSAVGNEHEWVYDALANYGVSMPKRHLKRAALAAIFLALMNVPVSASYSRSESWYRHRGNAFFSYTNIVDNIDELARKGLICNWVAPQGRSPGWQSRCWLSDNARILIAQFCPRSIPKIIAGELVIVRDKDGFPKPLGRSTEFRRMIRQMEKIQEIRADVEALGVYFDPKGYQQFGTIWRKTEIINGEHKTHQFNTANVAPCRIFNRNLYSGGRMYRDYVQSMPKVMRDGILMNGKPTCEPDFHAIHIALCYADTGKALKGDPYDLAGVDRPIAKMALNTIINAKTPLEAQRAVADNLSGDDSYWRAGEIIEELEGKHEDISMMFGTGIGLKHQSRDSRMAVKILIRCAKKGVKATSIHDSIRCKVPDASRVEEEMDRALQEETGGLAKHTPNYVAVENKKTS